MTWDDWKAYYKGSVAAVQNLNEELNKLEDALGVVHSTSAGGLFTALSQYARSNFKYKTGASGSLKMAIEGKALDCDEAADLIIGLWLLRNPTGGSVKVVNVHNSAPVLTPPIDRAGVKISNNLSDGNRRMIFSGGHRIAEIEGGEYDLVGGLSGAGVSALYIKLDKIDKTTDFSCTLGATTHVFKKGWFSTSEGLAKFTAKPKITA